MSERSKVLAALAALGLGIAIVWAFLPILDNGFVWDDGGNLIAARANWDRGLAGIAWAFTQPFAGHYQPLTWLSYQVDSAISGATPRGVHVTQIVLHLLVTLAAGLLAATLARTPPLRSRPQLAGPAFPLLTAALFGLAPIRVESVAWATERRDLLGALFTVAAVALYLLPSHDQRVSRRRLLGVAALAAASALARAQMTLPLVLLLLDLWPLGRLGERPFGGPRFPWAACGRLIREKALLFAIAAASALAAIWAQSSSGALTSLTEHGVAERGVQALYGVALYPAVALLPPGILGPLLPLYERPVPFPWLAARYLLPALAAVFALVVIWRQRRRSPALTVATGAYLVLVLPVLGLAQSGIQLVADRYAYLATLPLVLLVAGAILAYGATVGAGARGLLLAALLVVLAASGLATRQQTRVWQDDLVMWRYVLAHSQSSLAENNLGQLLYGRGEPAEALLHLTRSLEGAPGYGRPWPALAAILEAPWPPGAPPATWVAATLDRALTHQPGSTLAHYATALAWVRSGDATRAETELRRLLAIDPNHDGARLALLRLTAQH